MANVDRELAKMLYPKAADVVAEGLGSKVQTAYVYGTALTDSEDGTVTVSVEGDAMGVDAGLEVPTSNAIQEGDRVLVSINGNVPVEAVVKGSGDETRSIASEALDVANATKQYFWHDDAGAHVSTEALNPTGPSNSLWNSLGLLIRKAANYLVSITQSAIAFYDGNGNNASNVVASFGSSGAQIGKNGSANIGITSTSVDMSGSNGTKLFAMELDSSTPTLHSYTNRAVFRTADVEEEYDPLSKLTIYADNINETSYATLEATKDSGTEGRIDARTYIDGATYEDVAETVVEANAGGVPARVALTSSRDTNDDTYSTAWVEANDVHVRASNAHYQFTGTGNVRTNDDNGNATAYFMKYNATSDTRTQLEHRGACIWQNSSGNLHLANGTTDSNSTWEYSFEAGGLYRRTKSGSSWSSWTKIG